MAAPDQGWSDTQPRRKHLVIAGTGRAGTSFVVRFLTELGLDTHISRFGESTWDEAAQAGLENGFWETSPELPYVVKSPWAYQFIDQALANPEIEIEAVIVPIRKLMDAAASRIIVELQSKHHHAPWMADTNKTWIDCGPTPGGAVFSLNAVDQARVLALGFHYLIERLVVADVPIVFVVFPRLIEEPEYLFNKLKPLLPTTVSLEQARQSHRRIADPDLVRVGRERRYQVEAPSFEELDNIALRRELRHLRSRLATAETAAAEAAATADTAAAEVRKLLVLEQSRCHRIGRWIRAHLVKLRMSPLGR